MAAFRKGLTLYKGQEKELDVREEHWFPRYFAVNADTLNNVARKNPTARIKMVGIQGDLKFGVRTKLEWTALQEDIQAQVLEGTITKRPEWLQVAFEDIKTELDWVDEGDGNRVLILCSCPARIGDDHKIMEQVDAMCQGNPKVEITFSKAGNAASNMFESGAVFGGEGGGGGGAAQQEYSDELVAWFSALKISDAKTREALDYLCVPQDQVKICTSLGFEETKFKILTRCQILTFICLLKSKLTLEKMERCMTSDVFLKIMK